MSFTALLTPKEKIDAGGNSHKRRFLRNRTFSSSAITICSLQKFIMQTNKKLLKNMKNDDNGWVESLLKLVANARLIFSARKTATDGSWMRQDSISASPC